MLNGTNRRATESLRVQSDSGYVNSSDNVTLEYLKAKFLPLPAADKPIRWLRKIPIILPPFMFKKRLIQLILYSGKGLKSGITEEMSQHVLVDALFVTLVASRIFQIDNSQLFLLGSRLNVSFLILTVVIHLCSLVSQIVWICSFIQIHERCDHDTCI